MKKFALPQFNMRPWRERDAGATAARDWTILFVLFLFGLLFVIVVQGFLFYSVLTGKTDTTLDTTDMTEDTGEEILHAHEMYQEKIRAFESHTGVRI